ncbi:hypothetical protein V7S43_011124 [Phytophthora oleae]|uniref:RxLR effector protein n=1 Tax=Phytophthora oleae TaxID=2107226 RepID=A0ABD3FFD5_9STRA
MFTQCSYVKGVLLVAIIACISAVSATSVPKEAYISAASTSGRVLAANVPGLNQVVASKTKWTSKLIQSIKLRVGNQSPGDAFKILQLDKMGAPDLLSSPGFLKWVGFVRKAEQNAPEKSMFSVLATRYTDDALAAMFAAAKKTESTQPIAVKLEGIQLSNWENAGKSSNYVYKALKLHKTETLFESPVLSTWVTYVTRTQPNNADEVILAKLAGQYGDVALAKMIAAASKVDSTVALATELRAVQFQYWLTLGGTPKKVNKLIRMAANSDELTKKVARDYRRFYRKAMQTDLHD